MITIANECGQKWYRLSSWRIWKQGKYRFRPIFRQLQDGSGFAIGPIMIFRRKS